MSTWRWYSSWEISSAARAGDSCSAAIHTSAASSTTFLPMACTPASSSATVPEPVGRRSARERSSAKRSSKDFTPAGYRPAGRSSPGGRRPLGDGLDRRVRGADPLLPPHPEPDEEAPDDDRSVHAVHHRRRVELEVQELRDADEVD